MAGTACRMGGIQISFIPAKGFEMDDSKHKVTLYLPHELHRQLKIKAAVEELPMSALAERALQYLLDHPEVVEAAYGHTHQVYQCPECTTSLVLRSDALETLPRIKGVLAEEVNAQECEELSLVG